MVRGTALDWFSGGVSTRPGTSPVADAALDLHGLSESAGTWRLISHSGLPVLQPFGFLSPNPALPRVTSLYLLKPEADGTECIAAEAHLSARRGTRELIDAVGWATSRLVRTALRRVGGISSFQPPATAGRAGLATALAERLRQRQWRLRERLQADIWAIGLVKEPIENLLCDRLVEAERWAAIPEREGFIADPFPWPGEPSLIAYERFSHRTGLGSLEIAALFDEAAPAQPIGLPIRTHLSYPMLFLEEGRTYCLPEMAAERRQALYEILPDGTVAGETTIADDVAMADPTLFRQDGLYWLSYNDVDLGLHENLCLRFAERLRGPWNPHPGNPVKIDIRSSRPAGALFRHSGALYRPAQDCSATYGGALAINRVIRCTPDAFEEETVAVLRPRRDGPFPHGLHTISIVPGAVLVDGKRVVGSLPMLLRRILRRLA